MNSDRTFLVLTRNDPWSHLLRRFVRLGRISLKLLLFTALGGVALLGAFFSPSTAEAWSWCVLLFVLVLLAWGIARIGMSIWRALYLRRRPPPDDSAPPESPDDGAPVPAPLRPFSPLILSAHAQLPKSRQP